MSVISPRDHIKGSPAGDDALALADKIGVPITLDLLKLPPHEARVELVFRIGRKLCDVNPQQRKE